MIYSKFDLHLKLNLHLFDTATQTTESSGLSAEMKVYYEKRLLDHAEPALIHEQFSDKYPIPKGSGKTIEFRKYSSLPKITKPLTEGVTPDGQDLSVSTITAEVSQYGGWIRLSDMLDLTAIDNNVVQSTKLLGSQAGRVIDTINRDVLAGGTSVIYAPKTSQSGVSEVTSRADLDATSLMSVDLIMQAATFLKKMNASPVNDSYVALIHPSVAYDLMTSEEWIDAHKYARPDNIYKGEIGKIGGVRFVESTECKIWKGEGCPEGLAVYGTIVLGAHAYASTEIEGGGLQHIVKQLGYGDDPLNQRSSCGWKATKAAVRLSEEFMVRIESCSKYSAADVAN